MFLPFFRFVYSSLFLDSQRQNYDNQSCFKLLKYKTFLARTSIKFSSNTFNDPNDEQIPLMFTVNLVRLKYRSLKEGGNPNLRNKKG